MDPDQQTDATTPGGEPRPELPRAKSLLGSFNELLYAPTRTANCALSDEGNAHLRRLLLGAVLAFVAYGLTAACFEGGWTFALAAAKAPVIILASLVLCAPSLYVFTSLAGGTLNARWLATALIGLAATSGLVLLGLVPVVWLFSVSSRSLVFVSLLHALVWLVTLGLGALQRDIDAATNAFDALEPWKTAPHLRRGLEAIR